MRSIKVLVLLFLLVGASPVQAADSDGDGIDDSVDNCPSEYNATQLDGDGDGAGAACDLDESFIALGPQVRASEPNTDPTDRVQAVDAALFPDRSLVIVWTGGADGSLYYDVYARFFDKNGNPSGDQFKVNQEIEAYQNDAQVAIDGQNNIIVVWRSGHLDSGDIFARRFSDDGTPLTDDFLVNSSTEGWQIAPTVAAGPDSEFSVIWDSRRQFLGDWDVYMRRFGPTGTPVGGDIKVNPRPRDYGSLGWVSSQRPAFATDGAGNSVVAWNGHGATGFRQGIYTRRFDRYGVPTGDPVHVNSSPDASQRFPAIAMNDAGAFIVAWASVGSSRVPNAIFARRYGSDGFPLGDEYQVTGDAPYERREPSVALNDSGEYVIAWKSWNQNDEWDIYAQRYDGTGALIGGEFQVNGMTPGWQDGPLAIVDEFGDITVSFMSSRIHGAYYSRFGTDTDRDGVLYADEMPDAIQCYDVNVYKTSRKSKK